MRVAFLYTFGAILPPVARAAFYDDPACLPKRQHDYVVVGAHGHHATSLTFFLAGAAGSAGPSDAVNPNIPIPFLYPFLEHSVVDWNYTAVPQAGLDNRTIAYPGKTLGGSTSINYGLLKALRGPSDDYDRCARVTRAVMGIYAAYHQIGLPSKWDLHPRCLILDREARSSCRPPADGHDTTGQIDSCIHGTSGPVEISVQGFRADLDSRACSRVLKAAARLTRDFPFNMDMNSGNPLRIGLNQFTIGEGRQTSAATAYLRPALSRPNLDVLLNTKVRKVLQTGTRNGIPVLQGVQLVQSAAGLVYTLNATNEVILSAGAVNIPQLLMLSDSGIGDNAQLSKFNIVNSPMVWQNLQDHVLLPNVWSVNATFTYDDVIRNASIARAYLAHDTIFRTVLDPSSGPCSPHHEFIFAYFPSAVGIFSFFVVKPPPTGHYMMIASNLITPTSRGTVTLNSASPWQALLIDPALLNTKFDIVTIREAIKAARRFAASPGWDGYIIGPFGDLATAKTDAELEAYARRNAATFFYPVGTAEMGPRHSSTAVVDPHLVVKGAIGLRVVNASVFPFIPTSHPQAAVYAFAERAAGVSHHASCDTIESPTTRC
ncbi:aryl-alcohol-oxidase from pleurotus Eryingii [Lactarius pseudohatsudake]|nr:aryl-alcohol-oxidase from pleurotus Eryingii [Lactarius pseudohatsudake]